MKFQLAYIISRIIGIISLLGGWSIFLSWTIARYFFARDLDFLEALGFYWILIFFWLAIFALLLLSFYCIANRKKLSRKVFFTACIILFNIPSVLIILFWQADIEKKTFVKVINESGKSEINLQLRGTTFQKSIGSLKQDNSKVFNYEPPYVFCERVYQKKDSLYLIIEYNDQADTVEFPTLYMSECFTIKIDSQLQLQYPPIPSKKFYF